ncbi:hypothetical protein C8R44DRAFT_881932 [Mycena epipterygia]|nr:hypothetical protein C8R44DRAFT_881932 [Mycena epipterygia]
MSQAIVARAASATGTITYTQWFSGMSAILGPTVEFALLISGVSRLHLLPQQMCCEQVGSNVTTVNGTTGCPFNSVFDLLSDNDKCCGTTFSTRKKRDLHGYRPHQHEAGSRGYPNIPLSEAILVLLLVNVTM